MDPQREQYLENLWDLRSNLYLLSNSNCQELNQAHWQRLWNEHIDLFGLVLVPSDRGRDDFEMRLNSLRRNIVDLATSLEVHLQPFQPQGLANALAAQPQQLLTADGRPLQPQFSPPRGSPAGGDIGQHLGEELSYLADVPEDSPPRRQGQGARMASRRGDVGSQRNPIALESVEVSEAATSGRTLTAGRQTRSIPPRSNQRTNTTQRQRQSSFENQSPLPPDDSQPRRRSQTERGGTAPVRRASNSSLRKQAFQTSPYPLNSPSFSQAPPNLVQQSYPPYPYYQPTAPAFSQTRQNPIQQSYPPHPHYITLAPSLPLAPHNPMPQAQQRRQASITLLTTGEAHLPNPIEWPQETPCEQYTQHWDGVINQIAGGLAMRGENPAGAARRLALYNQQYPRERASAMAPPPPLTAFQRNQNRSASASLHEDAPEAENECFVPMSPSLSPCDQDEDGTLSGPPAPPPSGPCGPQTYIAPSPGALPPPPSGPLGYPAHNEAPPLPPAPPLSGYDASIYDASPPANAVVSPPIRGDEAQPSPANPSVATLTAAVRHAHAASYSFTGTPDWRGQYRQQQQQQQQQQATADAAAAVEAAASPSNTVPAQQAETEPGNWDASAFEYDGDGRTEPN